MKSPWALALVLLCLGAMVVQAHIGDTIAQLREVYGATGKRVGNAMIYQKNGYSICVYFDGDHSAMEVFTRDGSDKAHTTISQKDIDGILTLEGESEGWSPMVAKSGNMVWLREDKKLVAHLSSGASPEDAVFVVMENQK